MILITYCLLIIILSLWGIIKNRSNLLFFILFMEIILITLTYLFTMVYFLQSSFFGQIYGLFILTIAAIESAIIIAIIVQHYRFRGNINVNIVNCKLKPLS